jgi:hypothetical protein
VLAGCKPKEGSTGAAMDTAASSAAAGAGAAANTTMATARSAADTGMAAARSAVGGTISLADLAGTWDMQSKADSGKDTTTNKYTLVAKADSTGWALHFKNRKPVAVKIVSVGGDSIVTEAGPFESIRRKGVQVHTVTVMRKEGDKLVGNTVAHYVTKGPDSVMTLHTEGTKAAK